MVALKSDLTRSLDLEVSRVSRPMSRHVNPRAKPARESIERSGCRSLVLSSASVRACSAIGDGEIVGTMSSSWMICIAGRLILNGLLRGLFIPLWLILASVSLARGARVLSSCASTSVAAQARPDTRHETRS